jgi:hypothetical protein
MRLLLLMLIAVGSTVVANALTTMSTHAQTTQEEPDQRIYKYRMMACYRMCRLADRHRCRSAPDQSRDEPSLSRLQFGAETRPRLAPMRSAGKYASNLLYLGRLLLADAP